MQQLVLSSTDEAYFSVCFGTLGGLLIEKVPVCTGETVLKGKLSLLWPDADSRNYNSSEFSGEVKRSELNHNKL